MGVHATSRALPPRGAAIQKNARLITQTAKMCSSLPLKNMYYVHIAFLLDTERYAPARLISISTAGLAPLEAAELDRYPLFQSVIITCPNHIEVNSRGVILSGDHREEAYRYTAKA